jgi:hypothetical protein
LLREFQETSADLEQLTAQWEAAGEELARVEAELAAASE